MKIKNHRLLNDDGSPVSFRQSPNMGGRVRHKCLVVHFTAGRSAQESLDWLTDRRARASAHVVIGRDGSVTQLVPFNRVAWHAGVSSWGGLDGMNSYSLGIELDNAGRLTCHGEQWRSWFGDDYGSVDVIQAVHKHESALCGWHGYTAQQIDSTLRVAALLMDRYTLLDVLGHEDIAPHRKCDPGPAFPMDSFRSRLLGRIDCSPPVYTTTTSLNIRSGPGTPFQQLTESPLPKGTTVRLISAEGTWWKVDVCASEMPADLEGWVCSRYLERVV